jgi:hypothetical protein
MRNGRVCVDPIPAAIVGAVLAVPAVHGRAGLAASLARRLLDAGTSPNTIKDRVRAIHAHRVDYEVGRARADLAPDPRLVLSGPARVPIYDGGRPSPAGNGRHGR